MKTSTRFACAASSLRLGSLLHKSRAAGWICLGLGVAVHMALTQIREVETVHRAPKPLTTHFVKRQPRLSKPLELKKRPQPRQRRLLREMVFVKARTDRAEATSSFEPARIVRSLTRPVSSVSRAAPLKDISGEPHVLARQIYGSRRFEQRADMSLEMLNPDALDTGQYHAIVVQYPEDKRIIKGFFHLAYVYSHSMRNRDWHGGEARRICGLRRLVDTINKYTDIRADLRGRVSYDDAELFKTPWIHAYGGHWGFELNDSETRNVGMYLAAGGFILGDGGASQHTLGNATMRMMFKDALATVGREYGVHWTFRRLPNHHPVYHCYFDFDNGPPIAGDYKNGKVDSWMHDPAPFDYLEGITIGPRLWAIMSNKGWNNAWGDWGDYSGHGYEWLDPTRPLQFGVNTMIFALTQEGSITHRLMDSVK